MKKLGVYIHIPFCISKCNYCDFNSYSDKSSLQMEYLKALVKEIKGKRQEFKNYFVDTIYIGGGTPSLLFKGAIATIISEVRNTFSIEEGCEISMEVNPNSVDYDKVLEWKNAGINRISIGLQTTNSNILKILGRSHNKEDYKNAITMLKSVGFSNINTDLMIGLPKQKLSHLKHSLNYAIKLGSSHISCYSLILEKDTPLYNAIENNLLKLPKEEKALGMYAYACMFLEENEFFRYEVSNFSKKGKECKHNLNCWNMQEYIGFGAGAHSFYTNKRTSNALKIEEYIETISKDESPLVYFEELSKEDLFEEYIMLKLRTKEGVNLLEIKEKFDIDILTDKKEVIDKLQSGDFIKVENQNLFITDRGFYLLNKVILEIVS